MQPWLIALASIQLEPEPWLLARKSSSEPWL